MIIPLNSDLCGMCKKVVNCPCECHISDLVNGFHEHVFSMPTKIKVKNEGPGPERVDFNLMRLNKIPKTLKFRIREIFKIMRII